MVYKVSSKSKSREKVVRVLKAFSDRYIKEFLKDGIAFIESGRNTVPCKNVYYKEKNGYKELWGGNIKAGFTDEALKEIGLVVHFFYGLTSKKDLYRTIVSISNFLNEPSENFELLLTISSESNLMDVASEQEEEYFLKILFKALSEVLAKEYKT